MKSTKSLHKAQQQMRDRQQQPRGPGRPALPISRNELLDLWARGYSPRGMTIHFGCDQRTINSRLAEFFPKGLKLSKLSPAMLYYLIENTNDPRFVVYFLKRHAPKIDRSIMLYRARLERRKVEKEFRQRQKLEAVEREREMPAAETNDKNDKEEQNHASPGFRASRGWKIVEFF